MKYLELEIYSLRIQILAAEMTQFYLKILTFGPVLTELVFRFIFQFSIFISYLQNGVSFLQNYFSAVFKKLPNISQQELSLYHILK